MIYLLSQWGHRTAMKVMSTPRCRTLSRGSPGCHQSQSISTFRTLPNDQYRGLSASSLYPVQDIAEHRPAWRLRHGVLAQNPVVIEPGDGLILFLELDPQVDEVHHLLIPTRQWVSQRGCQDIGLWDGHGIGRVQQ